MHRDQLPSMAERRSWLKAVPLSTASAQAGVFFALCGIQGLVATLSGSTTDSTLAWVVVAADLLLALGAWGLPRFGFPMPTSAVLVLPAFATLGLMLVVGSLPARTYSVLFALTLAWVGIHSRPRRSLMLLPFAVVAYSLPLMVSTVQPPFDPRSLVVVMAAGVLLAETIARTRHHSERTQKRLEASERELRLVTDHMTDLVTRSGPDGVVRYASPSAPKILGWEPDEMVGRAAAEFCHPDDLPVTAILARSPAGTTRVSARRLLRKDGSYLWVESVATVVDTFDSGLEVHSIARDITERMARDQALVRSESEYRQAFEGAPVAMAHVSAQGRFVKVNPAMCEMTGYGVDDLIGTPVSVLVHPDDAPGTTASLDAARSGEATTIDAERRLVRRNGQVAWVHVTGAVVKDGEDQFDHLLVHYLDITTSKTLEEQLRHLAEHDSLSGVGNRRRFEIELAEHVKRARRYGPTGALLLLDIDNFKRINDTLGHPSGDQVIVAVTGVLRRRLRTGDRLARLGGDEFAVLLAESDRVGAESVAADLVRSLRDELIVLTDGSPIKVTTSIGVAVLSDSNTTDVELLARADIALYDAKHAGRDGFSVAASSETLPRT